MTGETRVRQGFCHDVSQLTAGSGVGEVNDVVLAPVTNDVMLHVDVFGSLGGREVGGHLDASLVVFAK